MLFKIVNNEDIEKISFEIQNQIVNKIKTKGRMPSVNAVGAKYQSGGEKSQGPMSKSV